MYSVSEDFITALHKEARFERLRGTIGGYSFTDNNVLSLTYSNRCSDTKDVTLGSAYIGQIELQVRGINIPRGSWLNKKITLEWGLVLEDESVEYIPVGVFYVSKANWTTTGVSLIASDIMSFLDAPIIFDQSIGTPYSYLAMMSDSTGIGLGVTQAQVEAMPNGTMLLSIGGTSSLSTWRDLISYLAQVVGGFAYATRDGKLALRSFDSASIVDEITNYERELGSSFSDYTTEYAGVSIVDADANATAYYYGDGGGGDNFISLGNNPLMQVGTQAFKDELRQNVADVVATIKYTPFNFSTLSSVVYDLGDLLTCSGGVAGLNGLTCCIMSIEWTSKALTTWQGFGADPSLTNGRSKEDRAITALAQNQKSDGITYYTYINGEQVTLTTTPQTIVRVKFAVNEKTTVTLWHELKLLSTLAGDDQEIHYEWYVDGTKLNEFEPVDTFGEDGYHTEPHFGWLKDVIAGQAHVWEVKAYIDSGSAICAINDCHAMISGQKMVATTDWSGSFEVEDEFSAIIYNHAIATLTDSAVLTVTNDFVSFTPSDTIGAFTIGQSIATLTDSAVLTLSVILSNIVTEGNNPKNLVTEGATPENLVTEGE